MSPGRRRARWSWISLRPARFMGTGRASFFWRPRSRACGSVTGDAFFAFPDGVARAPARRRVNLMGQMEDAMKLMIEVGRLRVQLALGMVPGKLKASIGWAWLPSRLARQHCRIMKRAVMSPGWEEVRHER